jgi:beta-carotene 3-hydroxylase
MELLILTAIVSFLLMEIVSYLAHRFVYHGIGWVFHRSHHSKREGPFELNDIFPTIFAAISILLMAYSYGFAEREWLFAVACGVAAYGIIYFLIHDVYIHRRIPVLSLRVPFLLRLKKAHAIHHAFGGEPYGLLFFLPGIDRLKEEVNHETTV